MFTVLQLETVEDSHEVSLVAHAIYLLPKMASASSDPQLHHSKQYTSSCCEQKGAMQAYTTLMRDVGIHWALCLGRHRTSQHINPTAVPVNADTLDQQCYNKLSMRSSLNVGLAVTFLKN